MTPARRVIGSLIALILVAVTLTACLPPGRSARASVGAGGFDVSIQGVHVIGPAGVAPEGTLVEVKAIDLPLSREVSSFAAPVASGVEITLDGGAVQPQEELQIVFEVPADSGSSNLFVLGEDESTGTGVAFVDSVWDAEHSTLTATVSHLSWFGAVDVDGDALSTKVGDWINQSLGVESAKPDCVDADSALHFSKVPDDVVWPCAEETAGGASWSLQSNSGLVWEVLSEPKAHYDPLTALGLTGIATIEAVNLIGPGLEGDTVVIPMETLTGSFGGQSPYTIALQVEPGLSQIATIMFGLSMIFPTKWVELASRAECLVDVVQAATSSPSGETVRTILGCVGDFLEGAGGGLIGILLTGPGLLASQLEGIAREISQTNTVQFTLGYSDATQVASLPPGAAWLYELPQEIVPHDAEQVAASVPVGDKVVVFRNSSSVWVGCDGDVHVEIFYLDGEYSELSFGLGLLEHTPDGMSASFQMRVVGEDDSHFVLPQSFATDVGQWTLQRGTILERQTVSVEGVSSVALYSATDDACGTADIGYGALLDAYVR